MALNYLRCPWLCLIPLILLSGCAGTSLNLHEAKGDEKKASPVLFQLAEVSNGRVYASAEFIRQLSNVNSASSLYHFGPGDIMDITVWKRPEVSRQGVLVGPDGVISIPKVGIINVRGMTLNEMTERLKTILAKSYENPDVSITVREFHNNKAFVLGRVSQPGVVNFPGNGTLLEALALAGGLPHTGKETHLSRCAIIRGRDSVIWIDLRDLLDGGNMALNARIENNDVIFIPEAEDEMVMVLGSVNQPGAVLIKPGLSLMDAVMQAGGYTNEADLSKVFLVRPSQSKGDVRQVNLKKMLQTGGFTENYLLQQDDIVYVSQNGASKFNYFLEQLMPSLQFLSMSSSVLNDLNIIKSTDTGN